MNFILTNKNYCAVIVEIKEVYPLPKCDNVQGTLLFGNQVIVDKNTKPGDVGVYFPTETALSPEFLKMNNLRNVPEDNFDTSKKGFFEAHGRVKTLKFRGQRSEAFWIPITSLYYLDYHYDPTHLGLEFNDLSTFDQNSYGAVYGICTKYISKRNPGKLAQNINKAKKAVRKEDLIVADQLRLHYDTEQLGRNMDRIHPDMDVTITSKWHGTSAVVAKLLVKHTPSLMEKLLRLLGVNITEHKYGLVWTSRKVVKGVIESKPSSNHFYGEDIWGIVAKELEPNIPFGFTLYCEIVGFTAEGGEIQQGYHYGCAPGQHKTIIYRITNTTADGLVVELTWNQLKEFCKKNNLTPAHELYQGKISSVFDDNGEIEYTGKEEWDSKMIQILEKKYANGDPCRFNNNEVPSEGMVLRIDRLSQSIAFKLKSFNFLKRESCQIDQEVLDIETEESIQ